jgi:glycosyltransferase involved in cell wall biosynthesis
MISAQDSGRTTCTGRTTGDMGSTLHAGTRVRVVLVAEDLDYGGAERQVIELANNLDQARFEVHVCALSDYVPLSEGLRDVKGTLHIIKPLHRYDFTIIARLAWLLRALRADIVHGFLFTADIVSRCAGHLAGTRAVVGSERNAVRRIEKRHLLGLKLTRRWVDVIVANSSAGAEYNGRVFNRPASDYRVVHNGVDTERFRPSDSTVIRNKLQIPQHCPVVGAFANMKGQKNHEMLFRTFKRVLDALPETRLLLVGDAPADSRGSLDAYKARMHRIVEDLRIGHRCMFLGHQEHTEELYPACDITALSSLFEGTPNVLLESMACGVPFVATDVSDNRYIAKQGEVGHLVAVGDTVGMAHRIKALLSNHALRHEMGQSARRWVVEEFSTKRFAAKMEAVYMEVLRRTTNDGDVARNPNAHDC